MDLTKEEYIKMKQREYYLNKYKNNDIRQNIIKRKKNDKNEDEMKYIYRAACNRIKDTIIKYKLNIEFSYKSMLGCDRAQFKEYIISNLQEGMTLNNFGEWEMDHTIPISSFKFKSIEEIKECFNHKNIKPMWKHENRVKYNKVIN